MQANRFLDVLVNLLGRDGLGRRARRVTPRAAARARSSGAARRERRRPNVEARHAVPQGRRPGRAARNLVLAGQQRGALFPLRLERVLVRDGRRRRHDNRRQVLGHAVRGLGLVPQVQALRQAAAAAAAALLVGNVAGC